MIGIESVLRRDIQVILRLYHDPAEILLGFDIDSCTVGFNGSNVLCLPRFKRAITQVSAILFPLHCV
jgi:hypothetical protein